MALHYGRKHTESDMASEYIIDCILENINLHYRKQALDKLRIPCSVAAATQYSNLATKTLFFQSDKPTLSNSTVQNEKKQKANRFDPFQQSHIKYNLRSKVATPLLSRGTSDISVSDFGQLDSIQTPAESEKIMSAFKRKLSVRISGLVQKTTQFVELEYVNGPEIKYTDNIAETEIERMRNFQETKDFIKKLTTPRKKKKPTVLQVDDQQNVHQVDDDVKPGTTFNTQGEAIHIENIEIEKLPRNFVTARIKVQDIQTDQIKNEVLPTQVQSLQPKQEWVSSIVSQKEVVDMRVLDLNNLKKEFKDFGKQRIVQDPRRKLNIEKNIKVKAGVLYRDKGNSNFRIQNNDTDRTIAGSITNRLSKLQYLELSQQSRAYPKETNVLDSLNQSDNQSAHQTLILQPNDCKNSVDITETDRTYKYNSTEFVGGVPQQKSPFTRRFERIKFNQTAGKRECITQLGLAYEVQKRSIHADDYSSEQRTQMPSISLRRGTSPGIFQQQKSPLKLPSNSVRENQTRGCARDFINLDTKQLQLHLGEVQQRLSNRSQTPGNAMYFFERRSSLHTQQSPRVRQQPPFSQKQQM